MRILIIAYDYPPILTPRALRWRYFARELALQGHDVHLLVPDAGEPGGEGRCGRGRITVHRTFPGPIGWLAGRRRRSGGAGGASPATLAAPVVRLNWRGRVLDAVKRLLGLVLFPDSRAEWTPWARLALRRLLRSIAPDVVVVSHEPASTLPLGIHAGRLGFPWVADLGDPVCAPYTPRRWRRSALALEARVSTLASHMLVTTSATQALLMERHAMPAGRCSVLPNGYDDRRPAGVGRGAARISFDSGFLELVYAGRLYGYRDPTPLLRAVAMTPGVRITLIVPDPPADGGLVPDGDERIRVLGPMPHEEVMRLQAQADVLVNLGNTNQPAQIPAKLYEYLGVPKPVLHVRYAEVDVAADLLAGLDRGWECRADVAELSALLASMQNKKRDGTLHDGIDIRPRAEYSHSSLGKELGAILVAVSGQGAGGRPVDGMPLPGTAG